MGSYGGRRGRRKVIMGLLVAGVAAVVLGLAHHPVPSASTPSLVTRRSR